MENKSTTTAWGIFITTLAWLCVGLGLIAGSYGVHVTSQDEHKFCLSNLSSFGSYAQGTVASLWSLGALFFLYATLLAQRQQIDQQERQLKLQQEQNKLDNEKRKIENERQERQFESQQQQFREDMEKRKFENERQAEQFKSQQRAIELQNFETSFFQLLNLFNTVTTNVKADNETFSGGYTRHEGSDCFKLFRNLLVNNYRNTKLSILSESNLPDIQQVRIAAQEYYLQFYNVHRPAIDHYFRILYHIIKFIETSGVLTTDIDKRRYTSLVRAQLTVNELFLLFYNGICPHADKFLPLIEKYGLLEHMDKKLLLDESHGDFYKSSAYK